MKEQARQESGILRDYAINPRLIEGFDNMIGFFNDIQAAYPEAISFVAGMPDESLFDLDQHLAAFNVYADHVAARKGLPTADIINSIGQYKSSKGIINDIVANYLLKDEHIQVNGKDIVITVGAQEAFAIIVSALCNKDNDVILTEEPSYIGLSSFARIFEYTMAGVPITDTGLDLEQLSIRIKALKEAGRNPKLLYVIPDYQNPSGCSMPVEKRLALLEMADEFNFLILEDSVYSGFFYEGQRKPTLKSLDKNKRVLYVGSFAKLLFPGLRIGVIAAEQQIELPDGRLITLADEFEKVKGQITNNTPTITQAILAGILLKNDYSLSILNEKKVVAYRKKRDAMLQALNKYVKPHVAGVSWNEPEGGFFIRMSLPFTIVQEDVLFCAKKYGVLFCPMRNFYANGGGENEIRLAFSGHTPENIEKGVQALAWFLQSKVNKQDASYHQIASHI